MPNGNVQGQAQQQYPWWMFPQENYPARMTGTSGGRSYVSTRTNRVVSQRSPSGETFYRPYYETSWLTPGQQQRAAGTYPYGSERWPTGGGAGGAQQQESLAALTGHLGASTWRGRKPSSLQVQATSGGARGRATWKTPVKEAGLAGPAEFGRLPANIPVFVREFYGLTGTGRKGGTGYAKLAQQKRLRELEPQVRDWERQMGLEIGSATWQQQAKRLGNWAQNLFARGITGAGDIGGEGGYTLGGEQGRADLGAFAGGGAYGGGGGAYGAGGYGSGGGVSDQIINMAARVLAEQTGDMNRARNDIRAAIQKLEASIGSLEQGQSGEWINQMAQIALEMAQNPGMSEEEVRLTFQRVQQQHIAPAYEALRGQVAEAGGPGTRQELGRLRLEESKARQRAGTDIELSALESRRAERGQAVGLLGQAAGLEVGRAGSIIRGRAAVPAMYQATYPQDLAGPMIQAITAQDPAAGLQILGRAQRRTSSGGGITRWRGGVSGTGTPGRWRGGGPGAGTPGTAFPALLKRWKSRRGARYSA